VYVLQVRNSQVSSVLINKMLVIILSLAKILLRSVFFEFIFSDKKNSQVVIFIFWLQMFEKGSSLGIWVLVFETQFKAVCRYSKNEITRWVQHVKQELPTLPEHLSSPLVFIGIHVAWSLVSLLCFVNHCLSFLFFFF
jgi:hypothetical protein